LTNVFNKLVVHTLLKMLQNTQASQLFQYVHDVVNLQDNSWWVLEIMHKNCFSKVRHLSPTYFFHTGPLWLCILFWVVLYATNEVWISQTRNGL